jgi:uncharacterized lipoprotein NlpE involved in copper resistance
MKNIAIPLLILLVAFACGESKKAETTVTDSLPPTADNSMTSLDWAGYYSGTLPCADCEGIKTNLTINNDLTFTLETQYLGQMDNPFKTTGTFLWNDEGSIITLQNDGSDDTHHYQVGENILYKLDVNGNRIEGDLANMYILQKQ